MYNGFDTLKYFHNLLFYELRENITFKVLTYPWDILFVTFHGRSGHTYINFRPHSFYFISFLNTPRETSDCEMGCPDCTGRLTFSRFLRHIDCQCLWKNTVLAGFRFEAASLYTQIQNKLPFCNWKTDNSETIRSKSGSQEMLPFLCLLTAARWRHKTSLSRRQHKLPMKEFYCKLSNLQILLWSLCHIYFSTMKFACKVACHLVC